MFFNLKIPYTSAFIPWSMAHRVPVSWTGTQQNMQKKLLLINDPHKVGFTIYELD